MGPKRIQEVTVLTQMFYGNDDRFPFKNVRRSQHDLEQRFEALAARWDDETAILSSLTRKITDPAYLEIIAIGNKRSPFGASAPGARAGVLVRGIACSVWS